MSNRLSNFGLLGVLLLLFAGCQKIKPEQVSIPEYPDLRKLHVYQAQLLHTSTLLKTVELDDKREEKSFSMDSTKWLEELAFMKELNPNLPEYVGVFAIEKNDNEMTLTLKKDEKGILKELNVSKAKDQFKRISGIIHEDKDVYSHHKEITVSFNNSTVKSYEITGYQKILLMDTVRFTIVGTVN